ncbi:MAG: outer membrane protein assembly factor BamA [Saprospiraceae bacterium]
MNAKILKLTILLMLLSLLSFGQDQTKKSYEIASINIKGAAYSSDKNILARSGLKVGQKISLPGYEIPQAIKNLMRIKLYQDVQIYQTRKVEDLVFLEIEVLELPVLKNFSIKNIKKSEREDLTASLKKHLIEGTIISPSEEGYSKKIIKEYFVKKGFLDVTILIEKTPCSHEKNCHKIVFEVRKNEKVKINNIAFTGNKTVSKKRLKKLMETKSKPQIFKKPFFIQEDFETDKKRILAYYASLGYRDAKITASKTNRKKGENLDLKISIEEGSQYQFGDITWKGNSKYSDTLLTTILGIKKGDIFNDQLLQERINFSESGRDISRLYMDDGHLFFRANPIEKALNGNQIDLEIQITEGAQATIGEVNIVGNDITNEDVIRRELRTLPGDKFNREELIRSQRSLINMGFFNPESVLAIPKPNPQNGTVDIEYEVEEKSNDQFELAGSWGGSDVGVVGSVGVQLNNFSVRKMFKKDGWDPFPRGDGQSVGLRMQYGGKQYQSYNFTFSEPWLNGKPNALSFGVFYNQYNDDGTTENIFDEHLNIFGANVKLGKRFKLGNEYIISRTGLNFQTYHLNNWSNGLFRTDDGQLVADGKYFNLNISQEFTRTTLNHPIFPTSGSKVSFTMQFTPPYSLFSEKDADQTIEQKHRLIEYHKWRLDAEKYLPVGKKLTLKLAAKMGFMGNYNNANGTTPFERFQLGGDALSNSQAGFTGTDRVTMRGYGVEDFETNLQDGQIVATPLFSKLTAELRFPISLNPSATVYGLAFLEAGNSWSSFNDYNPFNLKRAAGVGFRAHLPMFGTLGVDYGIGFDNAGAKTLSNLGRFNFTLGFELD